MGLSVCAPWATPDDLCFVPDGTVDDCVDGPVALEYKWEPEDVLLAVSNLLYARTGRKWPGVCEFSVWPCIDTCWSDQHPCVRCCSHCELELPSDYPVVSIESIVEDGVTLDASDYRLERRNRVVRLDGLRWQRNTFGLPCASGSGVETVVTYTAGVEPPIEGRMAAAALADELMKSCNGQTCALPAQVQSFARRGVTVELTDLAELMKSGATGIPIVDHFLHVHERWASSPTMADPARRGGRRGSPVVP